VARVLELIGVWSGLCSWKVVCLRVGSSRGEVKGVGWVPGVLGECTVDGWEGGQEYRAGRRILGSTKEAPSRVIKQRRHGVRAHEFFGGGFPVRRSGVRVCTLDSEEVLGSRRKGVGCVRLAAAEAWVPVELAGLEVETVDPAG
jgi:hypothetical protein